MKNISLSLCSFIVSLLVGCGGCIQKTTPALPYGNFVKITKRLEISKCKEKESKFCMEATFMHSGSGLALGTLHSPLGEGSIILTAGHICTANITDKARDHIEEYKMSLTITDSNNHVYRTIIVNTNNVDKGEADLCLLYSKGFLSDFVKYSMQNNNRGDRLYNLASPVGVFHPPNMPILDGLFSGRMNNTTDLTTVPAIGGSSGSAVFNDNGELVGVIYASVVNFPHVSLMTNRITTQDFIIKSLELLQSNPGL